MNVDDVRALVQAMEARPSRLPLLMPGTVAAVSGTVAEVTVDGDPDGSAVEAVLLTADVGPGDRVSLLFDPPRGVSVVGVTARRSEAGMVLWFDEEINVSHTFLDAGGTYTMTNQPFLTLEAARSYRFDYFAQISGWTGGPNYVYWGLYLQRDGVTIDTLNPFFHPHNEGDILLQSFEVVNVDETATNQYSLLVEGDPHNQNHTALITKLRWSVTDVGPTMIRGAGFSLTR